MDVYLGEIILFGFYWPPYGFATCNGAILNIQQNTALYSLLGVVFGGNGSTTFGLPNLGGRTPIGQGQSTGTSNYAFAQNAGVESVALSLAQVPAHTHVAATSITALTAPTAKTPNPAGNLLTIPATAGTPPTAVQSYAAPGAGTAATMAAGMATTTVQPAGSGQAVSIVQPLLALNYVISTTGIYPSRG